MRLLEVNTGRFRWVENPGSIHYAILSHVWEKEGDRGYIPEQTYEDVRRFEDSVSPNESILLYLSPKIRAFCDAARKDGFELGWADSCCIDKASSSELSEAINSMFDWYHYAGICYVFLHDVDSSLDERKLQTSFRRSKWFMRGWTLQELLAPTCVVFLSSSWKVIGVKGQLSSLIEDVTGIEEDVLKMKKSLDEVSVARRMSWAAERMTTREEDRAYSLMGIFGVNIPTMYGEGGSYAFIRLQEEIIKHIPDQTIFAWGSGDDSLADTFSLPKLSSASPMITSKYAARPAKGSHEQYLLASSPSDFAPFSSPFQPISQDAFAKRLDIPPEEVYQVYTTTPHGIHASFPLVKVLFQHSVVPVQLAVLACEDHQRRLLALILSPLVQNSDMEFSVGVHVHVPHSLHATPCRKVFLSLGQVDQYVVAAFLQQLASTSSIDLHVPF